LSVFTAIEYPAMLHVRDLVETDLNVYLVTECAHRGTLRGALDAEAVGESPSGWDIPVWLLSVPCAGNENREIRMSPELASKNEKKTSKKRHWTKS
jgi:hypothetical protein